MRNWYSFTDTEDIVALGAHESFDGASDAADKLCPTSVWIFPEEGLVKLADRIKAALASKDQV